MATNYILKSADELLSVIRKMEETYPDRIFVTGITVGGSVSAPNKKRNYYRHQLNHGFASDCFAGNGVTALMSGGGFYIAHVPKDKINPALLPEVESDANT